MDYDKQPICGHPFNIYHKALTNEHFKALNDIIASGSSVVADIKLKDKNYAGSLATRELLIRIFTTLFIDVQSFAQINIEKGDFNGYVAGFIEDLVAVMNGGIPSVSIMTRYELVVGTRNKYDLPKVIPNIDIDAISVIREQAIINLFNYYTLNELILILRILIGDRVADS